MWSMWIEIEYWLAIEEVAGRSDVAGKVAECVRRMGHDDANEPDERRTKMKELNRNRTRPIKHKRNEKSNVKMAAYGQKRT
jgi:hypothetical protein